MDFKWKLSRPGIEVEFETGSIGEAIELLGQEGTQLTEVFGFSMNAHAAAGSEPTTAPAAEEAPAKRGRGPNKPKDPVVAVAPPPMPIPAPAAPTTATLPPNALNAPPPPVAPSLAIPADGGIPPFLVRTTEGAAPPLPSVPSAPLAPTPPPVGVLGPKIVAALDIKKAGSPDGGPMLADWLAACGLTVPGATYDEACQALLFMGDGKLAGVAERLGIAA